MLTHLALSNFVLIDALSLDTRAGLSVITGETGAGKSILLAGLGLVTGGRSEAGMIGPHGERADVSAQFELPDNHPSLIKCRAQDLDEGHDLILRRTIAADGRTRAFVNGHAVPISTLNDIGQGLVEIQGQFDQLAILNPRNHRTVLDEAAGLEAQVRQVSALAEARNSAAKALAAETQRLAILAEEEDYLRHSLKELEAANLRAGEAEELSERRQALRSLSDAADSLGQLKALLTKDKGITDLLAKATKLVSRLPLDLASDLQDMIASLDQAWNSSEAAANDLNHKLDELSDSERELEDASDRLFLLKDLARKHSCQTEELPDKLDQLRADLAQIDQGQANLGALKLTLTAARQAYLKAAQKLSDARHSAGKKLARQINAELPGLKLPEARIDFDITSDPSEEAGAQGFDAVVLRAQTNRGSAPGPLHKIASGGELSRILLAMKLALTPQSGPAPLMVFDEADAGVGGATAAALGSRLRALAEHAQVIAVTHSPQLAAAGHQHLQVSKQAKGKATGSRLEMLTAQERVDEIARMIAGAQVGAEARQAAERLLAEFGS